MRPEVAHRRIESFGKRFGKAHLYLAYHAAFPLALTPDLLYRLWANFQRDVDGVVLNIPWVAVADLLLSSLCNEVGHDLYEMDTAVRRELLSELKTNPCFGQKRLNELSDFLLTHIKQQLSSHDPDIRDFAQAQHWAAIAYARPNKAALELAAALSSAYQKDRADLARLASLAETLAEPLAELEPLLIYARGMSKSARGNHEAAKAQFSKLQTDMSSSTNEELIQALQGEVATLLPEKHLGSKVRATRMPGLAFLLKGPLWLRLALIALFAALFALLLRPVPIGHTDSVNSVRFSGNAVFVLSGSDDCTLRRWEVNGDHLEPQGVFRGTDVSCNGRPFQPQGVLAVADKAVWPLRFDPIYDQRVAAGLENGAIQLLDVRTGKQIDQFNQNEPTSDRVFDLIFTKDSRFLFSGHGSGTVRVWKRSTNGLFQPAPASEALSLSSKLTDQVRTLALSEDESMLVSAGQYKSLIFWDRNAVNTRPKRVSLQELPGGKGQNDYIWSIAFLPGTRKLLATSDSDGYITIWNLNECQNTNTASQPEQPIEQKCALHARWLAAEKASVRSIAFDADGSRLFSAGDDGRIVVWSLTPEGRLDQTAVKGQEIFKSSKRINSIAITQDNQGIMIVSGGDEQVKLHRLRQENQFVGFNKLLPSFSDVNGVPTGEFVYTGEANGTWSFVLGRQPESVRTLEELLTKPKPNVNAQFSYQPQPSPNIQASSVPIEAVQTGKANFALTSLAGKLTDNLDSKPVAYDGLLVFVPFSKKEQNLPQVLKGQITLEQLRQLYTGQITNWQQLSGPNLSVKLYAPTEPEAVRAFEQLVFKDNPQQIALFQANVQRQPTQETQRQIVSEFDRGGAGIISFGIFSKTWDQCASYPLALVDGNNPAAQALVRLDDGNPIDPSVNLCDKNNRLDVRMVLESYPLAYPLVVVYPKDNSLPPAGLKFSELLTTRQGQCLLYKAGLVPLQPMPEDYLTSNGC